MDDAAIDALLLDPPFGTSTWRIVYEVGTLSCPNVDIEVGPQSEQVVSMTAGPLPDLDLISVEGMEENGTITFYRQSFDPSAAVYETADFIPPGGNEVVYYQMTFSSREQEAFADTVEGYIEASFEETVEGTTGRCELFRTFYGFLEGLE